ncbi:MAG: hypothetical protein WCJ43_01370 [Actinomycetes bacterium]
MAIKGPGLTKAGVTVLQFLLIFIFAAIELLFRHSYGIITGLALWIAFFGGTYLGRKGTAYVNAVAPPISLLITSVLLMPTIGGGSLKPTKFLLDLIAGLSAVAFYLLSGAAIAWFIWYKKERVTEESKSVDSFTSSF